MIQEFVDKFISSKPTIEASLRQKHPENYVDLVKIVIAAIHGDNEDDYERLDPDRIHEINDGDYQGTLVFVIAATGYQPSDYWYVKVGYGSCSGCDTLQAISGYSDEPPDDGQVADYMSLALHIVQGIKKMGD